MVWAIILCAFCVLNNIILLYSYHGIMMSLPTVKNKMSLIIGNCERTVITKSFALHQDAMAATLNFNFNEVIRSTMKSHLPIIRLQSYIHYFYHVCFHITYS